MVKVYSISVTNVLDGVASACRVCALVPQNSQRAGSSCVPCPAGFYIDRATNRCQECPQNTHLAGRHTYGKDACVACGPGSISDKVKRFFLLFVFVIQNSFCKQLVLANKPKIYFYFFKSATTDPSIMLTNPTLCTFWSNIF